MESNSNTLSMPVSELGSASTHDLALLSKFRMEIEQLEQEGKLPKGVIKLKLEGDQVIIESTNGQPVEELLRSVYPQEAEPPPIHAAALKKPYVEPEQPKLNRAQRRAMRR